METGSVAAIVEALNRHQVQYLIAGGLAVVAHGYVRFTADVDALLAMESANLQAAIAALESLGYKPRAPVAFAELLDPAARRRWKEEKNMIVFSLYSPRHAATEIDLFLDPPIDVPAALARAMTVEIAPGISAAFCGREDLIRMKTLAGRPRDLEDIAMLRARNQK